MEVEHEYDMDTAQEVEGEDSDVINERPSNDIQAAVYKVSFSIYRKYGCITVFTPVPYRLTTQL